jgi:hypothetical protein
MSPVSLSEGIARDFGIRIRDSLGNMSLSAAGIQTQTLGVSDPRFQSSQESRFLLGKKTSLGIEAIAVGNATTKPKYMSPLHAMALIAAGSGILTATTIELGAIVDVETPFVIRVEKEGITGEGPIRDLLSVDERFQRLVEIHEERVDISGGRTINVRMNWEIPFLGQVIPQGKKTLVTLRSIPKLSLETTHVRGAARAFEYWIPRTAIEMVGRMAYYVAYGGNMTSETRSELEPESAMMQQYLMSAGYLEEGA